MFSWPGLITNLTSAESVGRLVLDGVVNSDEWYSGNVCPRHTSQELNILANLCPYQAWVPATQDMDKVVDKFIRYCHEAGDKCSLYRDDDDIQTLRRRFDMVLADLAEKPRFFISETTYSPYLVTYSDVKRYLYRSTYSPREFPVLATLFDLLHREEPVPLLAPVDIPPLCWDDFPEYSYPNDGQVAVLCNDQKTAVGYPRIFSTEHVILS